VDSPNKQNRRRSGPIGFSGEAKASSLKSSSPSNAGGMGQATSPTRETPHGSKELKVAGPLIFGLLGVVALLIGLFLLAPLLIVIGICCLLGAIVINRNNRAETRLRSEFSKKRND
jgi:hypothetical protein